MAMFRKFGATVTICLALGAANNAVGQESSNRVNAATDWSVFTEPKDADKPKECWIVSAPTKVVNRRNNQVVDAKRSAILLYVTFVPGSDVMGEVAFTGGYSFKKDYPIKLRIGSSEYILSPEGEWAWPTSKEDDAKIRESMKRGATAVITASSPRPTLTEDTFSLKGFTAALEDAQKRCSG